MTNHTGQSVRRTLVQPVELEGVGLFSPLHSRLTVRPAAAGTGVVFRRIDLPDQPPIPARAGHVQTAPRKTVLVPRTGDAAGAGGGGGWGGAGVHTVEHLLSAMAGLGITDAMIDIHGAEVPMLDGSALPFALALRSAGLCTPAPAPGAMNGHGHAAGASPIVVTRPVRIERAGAWAEASPLDGGPARLDAEYRLDYGPGAPIAPQTARFSVVHGAPDVDAYLSQVAPARTFTTLDEALAMRKAGLFSHLREGDTLVIGPHGPVGTKYRVDDEPARHKLLDLIGDLSLAGRPIHGRVVACQSGHAMNHELAALLASQF